MIIKESFFSRYYPLSYKKIKCISCNCVFTTENLKIEIKKNNGGYYCDGATYKPYYTAMVKCPPM